MDDKLKAENIWKVVSFVKQLTSDPVEQYELFTQSASFVQNSVTADALRQVIKNAMFQNK